MWNYLYHEFILVQGAFGSGPDPYYTATRNAYNLVTGAMPAGVLSGSGRLMNREAFPWASWEPPMGSEDDAWQVLRNSLALRRGKGRDYLVFGRMQRPAQASGIAIRTWIEAESRRRIPAVFHSAWHNPAGKFAVVAANWTSEVQTFQLRDERLGSRCTETLSAAKGMAARTRETGPTGIQMTIPALGCALIEAL